MVGKELLRPVPINLSYVNAKINNIDKRLERLDTLFKQIEEKGVAQAWLEYMAKDIDDIIAIEGIEELMKHLDNKSIEAIINYVITSRC